MRSLFAALRTLVLPGGATTGPRIVLDGIAGRIEFYDAANNLVGVLRSIPTPMQFWGDSAGARIQIEPGQLSVVDATSTERIVMDAISVPPDLTFDGYSYPRGQASIGPFVSTGSDVARAAGALTDMTQVVDLHAGRRYRVSLHTQVILGTAGAAYELLLDQNGTQIGRFDRWAPSMTPAGSLAHTCNAFCEVNPTVDQLGSVLTVRNAAGSGGTVLCQAAANAPRHLTVEDIGF